MIKKLIYYGNPGLRKKCIGPKQITKDILQIAQDLTETVLNLNGAGLAAPQIDKYVRMFVIRYDNAEDSKGEPILCSPKVYINPTLSNPSTENILRRREGCLSIPKIYAEVARPYEITIEAMDLDGNIGTEVVCGWRARVIMHENDHLNGVLFIDRLPHKVRKNIARDLKKIEKQYNML